MIISVWRYSHLALAVSSFLLLTLASLTGIVLAFEPVMEKVQPYKIDNFDKVTLAQTIPVVKEKLPGLQTITVDENDFVIAKFSDEKGNDKTAYINPLTGAILGTPQKQSPLFEWTTSLHRSLFLHETGRLIVGITAFLLILIALSSIALIIQRQNGIRNFFAPIEKTSFAQYYHVVFGRVVLLFILALALSGTYLSVSRFIIKPQKVSAKVNEDDIKEDPEKKLVDFAVFQQTKLSQVASIEFPFSEFPEDYFTLKLKDRELYINQIDGDILAQQIYPKSLTLTAFSLRWHTGRSNIVWAVIMAITAAYILFFIYSGFAITWKRIRSKSRNKFKSGDCRVIILVGSENGSTYRFASAIYKQLLKHGEKVYLTDMDNYKLYPKAEHFVVMTSTYGEGDPPSNAKKFTNHLHKYPQAQSIQFSVVGFGSRNYEHYCQFAHHVDHLLRQQEWASPLMEMVTVNDRSPQDFSSWLTIWTKQSNFQILMPRALLTLNKQGLEKIGVIEKTAVDTDNAFLIKMKAKRGSRLVSGDLLAIYPKDDHRERLYSIGKVNGVIQLSVKLHQHGIGSSFLNALQTGDNIKARIIKNQHFHFPKNVENVVMISNGTGIAPFLGMIDENKRQVAIQLYCGFRTQSSFDLYKSFLTDAATNGKLKQFQLALSREGEKQYVSHLVERDSQLITELLKSGAVLMICGSLSMQKDVLAVLENICQANNLADTESLMDKGKILTDCY